jgi:hypothetical protein
MEGRQSEVFDETVRLGVLGEQIEDKLISVGPSNSPVWIGKKSEAKTFFTTYFDFVFEVWRKFKSGFGLPYGVSWIDQDQDLIDVVMMMQEHYEAHYKDRAIISRLDAILQRG